LIATTKVFGGFVTITSNVSDSVTESEVPVMLRAKVPKVGRTAKVPPAPLVVHNKLRVDVACPSAGGVTVVGLRVAVMSDASPVGSLVNANVTGELKPPTEVTVTVKVLVLLSALFVTTFSALMAMPNVLGCITDMVLSSLHAAVPSIKACARMANVPVWLGAGTLAWNFCGVSPENTTLAMSDSLMSRCMPVCDILPGTPPVTFQVTTKCSPTETVDGHEVTVTNGTRRPCNFWFRKAVWDWESVSCPWSEETLPWSSVTWVCMLEIWPWSELICPELAI